MHTIRLKTFKTIFIVSISITLVLLLSNCEGEDSTIIPTHEMVIDIDVHSLVVFQNPSLNLSNTSTPKFQLGLETHVSVSFRHETNTLYDPSIALRGDDQLTVKINHVVLNPTISWPALSHNYRYDFFDPINSNDVIYVEFSRKSEGPYVSSLTVPAIHIDSPTEGQVVFVAEDDLIVSWSEPYELNNTLIVSGECLETLEVAVPSGVNQMSIAAGQLSLLPGNDSCIAYVALESPIVGKVSTAFRNGTFNAKNFTYVQNIVVQ